VVLENVKRLGFKKSSLTSELSGRTRIETSFLTLLIRWCHSYWRR